MRSFITTALILVLTLARSHAQFGFPASQPGFGGNRPARNPAQTATYGLPNSINGGYNGGSFPAQGPSSGFSSPSPGLGNSRYPATAGGTGSSTNGSPSSPDSRILGLLGGGGLGGGGGGIFGNLLGALTGGNRRPLGGIGGAGGAFPYPGPFGVPAFGGGGFGYPGAGYPGYGGFYG